MLCCYKFAINAQRFFEILGNNVKNFCDTVLNFSIQLIRSKILNKLLALALITSITGGCVLHPPYTRPEVDAPDHWRFATNESATYANLRWWQEFGDPILDELIIEALENNKDLKVAIARVLEYASLVGVARSGFYPDVEFSGSGYKQKISTKVTALPPGTPDIYDTFMLLLSATYELDIWGKIRSTTEAAYAELLAQVEVRRTVVLTLVTSVGAAYIQLRQFDKQLDISRRTYNSRKESYELAVLRYEGGLTSELEAKQAEAEMEAAALAVIRLESLIAQQENLLSVLVGHNPESIERGLWLDSLHLPANIAAGIPSELLVQRPDLLQAEELLAAENARIGIANANFFPSINLTGDYDAESLLLKDLFTNSARTWLWGASFLQPVFTGGRLISQLEVAQARKWEAYYQYQQSVLNAFKEVDDALIAHRKAKELLTVQNRQVAALKEALDLATLQYENGQTDYLNVLDTQRRLFITELDLADIQGNTFLTLINLYKAVGGGWVIDADRMALPTEGSPFATPQNSDEDVCQNADNNGTP
jgi:multidrug efflux system outer membrane protein